uniref:Uncharacterized protein n=1 Tax=Aegilops tauschii subsp. strangulata TaxID=200361 RepID=A0A453Q401_AEGTS
MVHRRRSLSTPPALPLGRRNRWVIGSSVRAWIVAVHLYSCFSLMMSRCRSTGSEAEGPSAGGSRRVLGDIGNIVPVHVLEGNIQLPAGITPITRSFSAEL